MTERQSSEPEVREMNFGDPSTVIKYAPTSGVFGSDDFLDDVEGFVNKVVSKWYSITGNYLTVETPEHVVCAESLFPLYQRIRTNKDRLSSGQIGQALGTLIKTGSISEATALIDKALD